MTKYYRYFIVCVLATRVGDFWSLKGKVSYFMILKFCNSQNGEPESKLNTKEMQ